MEKATYDSEKNVPLDKNFPQIKGIKTKGKQTHVIPR